MRSPVNRGIVSQFAQQPNDIEWHCFRCCSSYNYLISLWKNTLVFPKFSFKETAKLACCMLSGLPRAGVDRQSLIVALLQLVLFWFMGLVASEGCIQLAQGLLNSQRQEISIFTWASGETVEGKELQTVEMAEHIYHFLQAFSFYYRISFPPTFSSST